MNKASLLVMILVSSFFVGCGDNTNFTRDDDAFQVRQDLNATGSTTLSFERNFLFRSISIGAPEADHCRAIADSYSLSSGVILDKDSLKLSYDQGSKHCARRNAFKQCETYQYTFSFNCQFKSTTGA